MRNWASWLEAGLFQRSRSMPPPWGPILRLARYPAALVRDSLIGEINVRAMSLAYTTLLSLVPLLVFIFSVLKFLGARGDLRAILRQFLRPLGRAADPLTTSIMQFVVNMHGDILGSIGLVFLVYTVFSTIQKVESSFNIVWRVQRPRSLLRRAIEYLAVMILGPIMLAVAVGLLGTAEHSPFAQWLDAVPTLALTLRALNHAVPYLIVTAVFTLMYLFLPNTRVQLRAALIGGVTAGVLWALVGEAFAEFILYSSRMLAVYTGFAIVLTALTWVYSSWLIFLVGGQLAFYVQLPQYLRHGGKPVQLSSVASEQAGLAVMCLIGRDYATGGNTWTATRLARELDIPEGALEPVLECLERSHLIMTGGKEHLLPARDPKRIALADIMAALRFLTSGKLDLDLRSVPGVARLQQEIDSLIRVRLAVSSLNDFIEESIRPRSSSP